MTKLHIYSRVIAGLISVGLLLVYTGCGGSGYSGSDNASALSSAESADGGYVGDVQPLFAGESVSGERGSEFHTEEYNYIEETGYLAVQDAPLSTFSADVDTASYSNVRRMLLSGSRVPADAVRTEEFLNYFQYNYPQPEGEQPVSITTELSNCPWNDQTQLLLIGLQAKEMDYEALPPSNLVFLLDVSGSMDSPDKLPLLKEAFRLLSEGLSEQDTVSIVTYAGYDTVALDGGSGADQARITSILDSLSPEGSTAGSRGIETAYQLAEKHFIPNGNNRVILATDGDLNVGLTSEGDLTRLIEEKRESGVFLSVLGFGTGNIKDNKMEALADHGNGNYAYIDSLLEAKKVLAQQLGGTLFTVAKDVKLQLEFNPEKLKGYRLLGYENRRLESKDFEDDTKDAGEMGAGHRVTALYELVPISSEQEIPAAPALKYQEPAQNSGSSDLLTVSIRYKEPDGSESKLLSRSVTEGIFLEEMPENLAFAASVAEFSMLLRDSDYKGTASYHEIIDRLSKREDVAQDEYKEELLHLVKTARRLSQ